MLVGTYVEHQRSPVCTADLPLGRAKVTPTAPLGQRTLRHVVVDRRP